jgi:hypothetical protein
MALLSGQPQKLRPITSAPLTCPNCGWTGVVGDCEPDDDGCLLCPECQTITQEPAPIRGETGGHT